MCQHGVKDEVKRITNYVISTALVIDKSDQQRIGKGRGGFPYTVEDSTHYYNREED